MSLRRSRDYACTGVFRVLADYEHSPSLWGPIKIIEVQAFGHKLNAKSLPTLQALTRPIMKAFTEGSEGSMMVAP